MTVKHVKLRAADRHRMSCFVTSVACLHGATFPQHSTSLDTYKQRGVRIVQDVHEVSHGWIAIITDLEGNVIQIYQGKA